MGKKRIVTKPGGDIDSELRKRSTLRLPKRKVVGGILHVQSTYNNTKLLLTDHDGNSLAWSSSGALGFKGAKKGTPYAASRVADLMADKASAIGIKKLDIILKGVGAGRESSIRTISSRGFDISVIKDVTPIPHNGPRPPKPRRV